MSNLDKYSPTTAWFGPTRVLMEHLTSIGAEMDDAGNYMIYNKEITLGMGGDEVIVPSETVIMINGEKVPLAASLVAGPGLTVKLL